MYEQVVVEKSIQRHIADTVTMQHEFIYMYPKTLAYSEANAFLRCLSNDSRSIQDLR